MSQTIDPVRSSDAYRASLLAELGDDDPAIVQAETINVMRTLVADAGDKLRVRPEPGEWSVLECIGHLADGELVVATRERWILAEDDPDIVGYDQALWVDRLEHNADEPELLLSLFEAVRRSNLDLWARRSAVDRGRVGHHRERGDESYEMTFRLAAGHDRVHLAQARRALDAVTRTTHTLTVGRIRPAGTERRERSPAPARSVRDRRSSLSRPGR